MTNLLNEFKGIFVSCNGEWNKNTNSFHKYTDMEKYNCCINQYKPTRDYCLEQCNHNYDSPNTNCESICHNTYNLGIDTCKLMNYVSKNYREDFYIPIKMNNDSHNIIIYIMIVIIIQENNYFLQYYLILI